MGHPPRSPPGRTRPRTGQAGPLERDPRTIRVRADLLRLTGTGLWEQRDPRSLREPRVEGALPRAAPRQPHRVVLLDDRAPRGRRPEGLHRHGGPGRRRMGDQRREVVLVVRRYRSLHHRDGNDRPRRSALRALLDVRAAAGNAWHQRPAQRRSRISAIRRGARRLRELRERAGGRRPHARAPWRCLRRSADPARRGAHPPRHAHRGVGAAHIRHALRARRVAVHPGRGATSRR